MEFVSAQPCSLRLFLAARLFRTCFRIEPHRRNRACGFRGRGPAALPTAAPKQLPLLAPCGKVIAMSVTVMPQSALRLERADSSRLVRAFVVSLAVHLLIWGTWYGGDKLGWWRNWEWPHWMRSPKMLTEILKKNQPAPEE